MSAVYWLCYAYVHDLIINQNAYHECIRDLDKIKISKQYL